MNTESIQNIQNLIDQVQIVSKTKAILIANNESQAKMFEEMFPGVKVVNVNGRLRTDDITYILPYEEKSIKVGEIND